MMAIKSSDLIKITFLTALLAASSFYCQAKAQNQVYPNSNPNAQPPGYIPNNSPANFNRNEPDFPSNFNPYGYPNQNAPVNPGFRPNPGNVMQPPQFRQVPNTRENAVRQLNSRYRSLLKQAERLIAQGHPNKAFTPLAEAITILPKTPEAYFWQGLAYDQMHNPKKAVNCYANSLKWAKARRMDSPELRINLGNSLIKLGFLKESIFDYERAIEIEPTNGLPHLYLGRAYLIKEDFNLALDEFRKCEELRFHHIYLPFFKSLSLAGLKRYSDAKSELTPLLTSYLKTKNPRLNGLAEALNKTLGTLETQKEEE